MTQTNDELRSFIAETCRQCVLYPDANLRYPLTMIMKIARRALGDKWPEFSMQLCAELFDSFTDTVPDDLEDSEKPYTHEEYIKALGKYADLDTIADFIEGDV